MGDDTDGGGVESLGAVSVGYECACAARLPKQLDDSATDGFSFLVVPLSHPRYVRPAGGRDEPWTRSDKLLKHAQYSSVIVARVSRWAVDALAAPEACSSLRDAAEIALTAELEWASHIGVYACLVDAPLGPVSVLLAGILRRSRVLLWLRFRWHAWPTWCQYSALLEHSSFVLPVLQLCGSEAPKKQAEKQKDKANESNTGEHLELDSDGGGGEGGNEDEEVSMRDVRQVTRWLAEPLKAVFFSTAMFPRAKSGNPLLPRSVGSFLYSAHSSGAQLVLQGRSMPSHPISHYRAYVELLMAKRRSEARHRGDDNMDANAAYNNVLQTPLQPLADHLESGTYEVFETDPVKYQLYEDAITHLLPRYASSSSSSSSTIVIVVAGAGRGPLVSASIRAARRANLLSRIRIYALEKNPNAIQTLRNMSLTDPAWQQLAVRVVHTDMREWLAPERAHLLVSELLGSFADNELSPECLDWAVRCLRADGVSVPHSYTSFIAPVSAPRIWAELHAQAEPARLETPYVVKLQHAYHCCGEPKSCFTFVHKPVSQSSSPSSACPAPSNNLHNRRYTSISFECGPVAAVVHGFAGYFECVLAGTQATDGDETKADQKKEPHERLILMSTKPGSMSAGMFSWFPLFLPLRAPLLLAANSRITLHLWRCVGPRKVWYEWAVASADSNTNTNTRTHTDTVSTQAQLSAIHNPNGRSYSIGL